MSANQAALAYLFASILFILALRGLSSPSFARRGNLYGMLGMVVAIVTTFLQPGVLNYRLILFSLLFGGLIGTVIAQRIKITAMPQLVAAMHSLVGLAAVLIAISALYSPATYGIARPGGGLELANRIEMFIGTFIGAITFTGSVVAFGKLSGFIRSAPLLFRGQHPFNLALFLLMTGFGVVFVVNQAWGPFLGMIGIALLLGVLVIAPIGGADMPVVISMLNSYSGWAAAGIGFTLNNNMLIIAGALIGSSGAILSYIMCKAMNRSIVNVLLGGFGVSGEASAAQAIPQRSVKSGSAEDAAFILSNAGSIIIVPGYGLAVAHAQHALQEMVSLLGGRGIKVRYAIHPVAGRMPGHMNVILAEAAVPYDQVLEMDEINSEFGDTDVAFIIGANDVVNPAAKTDSKSPIYGMPILEANKARTILVNKRSMASGYAGLDNELFYMDKTMMIFGDAKKTSDQIVQVLKA